MTKHRPSRSYISLFVFALTVYVVILTPFFAVSQMFQTGSWLLYIGLFISTGISLICLTQPGYLLFYGLSSYAVDPNVRSFVVSECHHIMPSLRRVEVLILEDESINAYVVQTVERVTIYFTEGLLRVTTLHEIKLVIRYLTMYLTHVTFMSSVSVVALASILERLVVTSIVGSGLIHAFGVLPDDLAWDKTIAQDTKEKSAYSTLLQKLEVERSKEMTKGKSHLSSINFIAFTNNHRGTHLTFEGMYSAHLSEKERVHYLV